MPSILIIASESENAGKLQSELSGRGYSITTASYKDRVLERVVRESPELIILEMDGTPGKNLLVELTRGSKINRKIPTIVLLKEDSINQINENTGVDDFLVKPFGAQELELRVNRVLTKNVRENDEILRCGELVIDLANCEVRFKGKIIELTYKEYELLKFLASGRGRVFTREALLNKVWGYDYFGGDRTVDVHIRRLRSKIEISGETFIETVRNIGYRFRKC